MKKQIVYFIILGLILCTIICVLVFKDHSTAIQNPTQIFCTTEACIRSANEIINSMNTSVDPCDDFYRFTCDRWTNQHPNHKWFTEHSAFSVIQGQLIHKAIKLLENTSLENKSKSFQKSRDMYNACLDQDRRNIIGYKPIFKYLSLLGLPAIPRFFNLADQKTENYKFDWIRTDALFNKLFDLQLLINVNVHPNMFYTTENIITFLIPKKKLLGSRSLTNPEKINITKHKLNDIQTKILLHYLQINMTKHNLNNIKTKILLQSLQIKFRKFAISTMIKQKYGLPLNYQDKLNSALKTISKLDADFSQLQKITKYSYVKIFGKIPVKHLQKQTNNYLIYYGWKPKEIWTPYLRYLFEDTNITITDEEFIHILPEYENYYRALTVYIANATETELELWYWWQAVKNLMLHTTTKSEELLDKFFTAIGKNTSQPKELICAAFTINNMEYALTSAFIDPLFLNTTKPKIKKMLKNIKNAFQMDVYSLSWMDNNTKELILEKNRAMTDLIGFPDWILNKTILEEYYSTVNINPDTHLDNLIEITKYKKKLKLEQLRKTNNKQWTTNPLQVNALNNILRNTIIIPLGIINFPIYYHDLEVLNYGSFGFILGHELTHGFDTTGRNYDKNGNYNQLWSNNTTNHFLAKTTCFINEFNNIYIPEADSQINGSITLQENLVDSGGLHHAYLAYQNHKKEYGRELKLPGLEKYTDEQLFFISYANVWCNEETINNWKYLLKNSHSPNRFRVLVSLRNFKSFAKAFDCPLGSKMNPDLPKCQIW